jgi:hypothetical protein
MCHDVCMCEMHFILIETKKVTTNLIILPCTHIQHVFQKKDMWYGRIWFLVTSALFGIQPTMIGTYSCNPAILPSFSGFLLICVECYQRDTRG